jgi:dTMP kinase
MKVICFEGIDGAGKATQVKMLEDLLKKNYFVGVKSFPDYSSPIGQLIEKWLRKEVTLTEEAAQLLYDADRFNFINTLREYEESPLDFLILDRYYLSNTAYMMAKDMDWKAQLRISEILRKPDITFLLDIPFSATDVRLEGGRDRNEKNATLMSKAASAYRFLVHYVYDTVFMVNGEGNPEEVHEKVVECLDSYLETFYSAQDNGRGDG